LQRRKRCVARGLLKERLVYEKFSNAGTKSCNSDNVKERNSVKTSAKGSVLGNEIVKRNAKKIANALANAADLHLEARRALPHQVRTRDGTTVKRPHARDKDDEYLTIFSHNTDWFGEDWARKKPISCKMTTTTLELGDEFSNCTWKKTPCSFLIKNLELTENTLFPNFLHSFIPLYTCHV
jgi:hypothetical protein